MRMKIKILFVFLVNLSWSASLKVDFLPQAMVHPGDILLQDVAKLQGDEDLIRHVQHLKVGRLTGPGRSTRLSASVLETFYLRPALQGKNLTVSGAAQIEVDGYAQSIERDSVLSLLYEKVAPHMQGQRGVDWILDGSRLPKQIAVPTNAFEWKLELPERFDGKGAERASLRVMQNGQQVSRFALSYTVRCWKNLVKLNRYIRRGQEIQTKDVVLERHEITHENQPFLTRTEDAVGRRVLRTISQGRFLSENWLERPWLVEEGQHLQLKMQVGQAVVSVLAEAQQNGYAGQLIKVRNQSTGHVVQAQIDRSGDIWVVN